MLVPLLPQHFQYSMAQWLELNLVYLGNHDRSVVELVTNTLITDVLTSYRTPVAKVSDRLVSNLLGVGAGTIAIVGYALVAKLLRVC